MPEALYQTLSSPRHGFKFNRIPTRRGSMYGGSITVYTVENYGAWLDTVFENADALIVCNGTADDKAVDQAIRDLGLRILPTHRAAILDRLKD